MNITLDDPRLTAFALNELDTAERETVQNELKKSPEFQREVEEISQVAALLSAELAAEPLPVLTGAQQAAMLAKCRQSAALPTVVPIQSGILAMLTMVLLIGFGGLLNDLEGFAPHSNWWSGVLTTPPIVLYLAWHHRKKLAAKARQSTKWAVVATLAGVIWLAFPMSLLAVTLPLPAVIRAGMGQFFAQAAAPVVSAMFQVAGIDATRDGLTFSLSHPFLRVMIAPECFPLASTVMLVVTSLLAGYYLLRSIWKRITLVSFVIALPIIEMAIRVFAVGEFYLRHGVLQSGIAGWIWFALLLAPAFLLLVLLRRSEGGSKPGS